MFEEITELGALPATEPRPNEMENFMQENQPESAAVTKQPRFKNDTPAANETGGMYGGSASG